MLVFRLALNLTVSWCYRKPWNLTKKLKLKHQIKMFKNEMGIKFCRFRVIQKALETVSKEEQRTIVQVTFGNVYIYEFINERVYLFIKKYEIHPFVKGLFCKYKPK